MIRSFSSEAWPGSEWQPMATAPKDGTHLLIYCPIEDVIVSSVWVTNAWHGTDPMGRLNWVQGTANEACWVLMPEKPKCVRASAAAHPVQANLQSDVEDPFARFNKEGWIFK
jgi:hypothetical protein